MTVIDIHTHLLPKVDDSRMKKHKFSSMMARYKEAGIDRIVFSPHIDDPYVDTKRDKIESTFEWAREKAAKAGIECTLGSEFYIRDQRELGFIPHFGTHVLCETDPNGAGECKGSQNGKRPALDEKRSCRLPGDRQSRRGISSP